MGYDFISDDGYGFRYEGGYLVSEPVPLGAQARRKRDGHAFLDRIKRSRFERFHGSTIGDTSGGWLVDGKDGRDPADHRTRQGVIGRVREWADYWSENATKPRGERAGILADMPTLALAGAAGCGKTHVAVGTLRRLAIRGGVSSWQAWTVAELLAAHKATFDDREARDPLPDCVEARVLLLDDLGAHGRTAWAAETLLGLIDARYRTNPDGVLILTTNAGALGTAGFWASLLGEGEKAGPVVARLASRLSEGALLVPFGRVEGGTFTPLRDERKGGE